MSLFRGPSLVPDNYRPANRTVKLQYSDGTAGSTTRHYLGTVEAGSMIRGDVLVDTAFNTSAGQPSVDIVLESAAGVVLQTLMVAATAAVTVASTSLKSAALYVTAKADVVAKYQRPATGNTAGLAMLSLTVNAKPSQDASSPTAYTIP